ncbi:transcription termination factor Rho [Saccharothrix syringae]|uniref:Transcription termination factor Rho n=1 Tax=Saccharothrix syringae TaxID=103733 RepID=A0A5Q0H6W9_SACSY|nr:transcription termination factor Rho [Saccharothrix syringae]
MTATLTRAEEPTTVHTEVSGILDVVGTTAHLRTTGYLPAPGDPVVPRALVDRLGLRRGDLVSGTAHTTAGRRGQARTAQVSRVDRVNGRDPASPRPAFTDLVPLHPAERLRLETTPEDLTTRVIDLLMPVGKGQRALVVAPPKAGKTSVLRSIARGIRANHPECHLMLVLVGERPEEVTDLRRAVPGEVVASTFDRSPADHVAVAELAVERAKRLVEQGRDVVVLLDSLTRLGRAYNLAAPPSGRVLSGGVDSGALLPPKRFLGAARNVEGGGSLTIFATALVETGSAGDTLIFEEYKATGNAELKLDRRLASRRVFPAVDVAQSGTRRDELLMTPEELAVTNRLRRALDGREVDVLLDGLRKTRTNAEFLVQLARG